MAQHEDKNMDLHIQITLSCFVTCLDLTYLKDIKNISKMCIILHAFKRVNNNRWYIMYIKLFTYIEGNLSRI